LKKVVIYTGDLCGFCFMAKNLLDSKNIAYQEINISVEKHKKKEMSKLSGGKTSVPQIFIGRIHIGGFDELHKLEREGKLKNFFNRKHDI